MEELQDIVEKNFEAYPDVAADILNVLLYGGEKTVRPENLYPAPTETVYQGRNALRSQYEDVEKAEISDGRVKALYLFANQTETDGKMLLRKAGYTGAAYREQYDGKMKDICPVVELVLYWGKKKWRGERNLKKFLRREDVPEGIWEYVDDMRLHVWEMRRLPPEIREKFTSDMRIVADYLAEGDGYRSDRKVVHKEALIKMIRVLSGDKNVNGTAEMLKEMKIREEDEIKMCELFDQYIRKGRSEGRKEGRAEGRKEGRAEGRKEGRSEGFCALVTTLKKMGKSFDETAAALKEAFHLEEEETEKSMKLYW